MTVTTTAMPSTVAIPEISISQRTRATICACAGLKGSSSPVSGLVMREVEAQVKTTVEAPAVATPTLAVPPEAPTMETATIAQAEAGERLDRALAAKIELSRSRLKALILAGHVAISGRTIRDPGHRVNEGDEIAVALPPA